MGPDNDFISAECGRVHSKHTWEVQRGVHNHLSVHVVSMDIRCAEERVSLGLRWASDASLALDVLQIMVLGPQYEAWITQITELADRFQIVPWRCQDRVQIQ